MLSLLSWTVSDKTNRKAKVVTTKVDIEGKAKTAEVSFSLFNPEDIRVRANSLLFKEEEAVEDLVSQLRDDPVFAEWMARD